MQERTQLDGLVAGSLLLLFAGVRTLVDTPIGGHWSAAVQGLTSQLGTTLPAGLRVLIATMVNLLAGAFLMRVLRGSAFESWGEALTRGIVGAVLLDFALLALLAGFGLFYWPFVAIAMLGAIVYGVRRGLPLVDRRLPAPGMGWLAWVLVGALWFWPLIIQLASPIVPFQDVLGNHIAPAEHVRAFGSFATLSTNPAPYYGASRIFLGYTGLLATLCRLTGLSAASAAAAFVFPLTILFAASFYRFARLVIGSAAAWWALLAVPLSFTFIRIPDARTTVLVVPLVLTALEPGAPGWLVACSLGAALLVHPLIAVLALMTWVVLSIVRGGVGLAAPAGALALAAPEILTYTGSRLPAWVGLAAFPLAWIVLRVLRDVRIPTLWPAITAGVALAAFSLVRATSVADAAAAVLHDLVHGFPLLTLGFAALVWTLVPEARRVTLAAVLPALALAGAVRLLPTANLTWQSFHDEIGGTGKPVGYWAPMFLAIGVAGGLSFLWGAGLRTRAFAALFLFFAILPARQGKVVGIDSIEEHRASESLAIALHRAEYGAWERYPDSRLLVDAPRRQLLESIRDEIAAHRINADTFVLHLASSFRPWVATPLAVFEGVQETTLSYDPEVSEHTIGSRLESLSDVAILLGPDYPYVILEPAGINQDFRPDIERAGYTQIFGNAQGTVFRRL